MYNRGMDHNKRTTQKEQINMPSHHHQCITGTVQQVQHAPLYRKVKKRSPTQSTRLASLGTPLVIVVQLSTPVCPW